MELNLSPSGRLSVCPVDRQQQRRAASSLLSAPREEISSDLCEQSGATSSGVEEEDEVAGRVADHIGETMERRQRHDDQAATELQLCVAEERRVVAAPQLHACQPTTPSPSSYMDIYASNSYTYYY